MKLRRALPWAAAGAAVPFFLWRIRAARRRPLATVPDLDLERYAGKWYEIARLPAHFERKCATDVTATYSLRPDGSVAVLNQCRREDGRVDKVTGTARPAEPGGLSSVLKVSFFWPFSGDYQVMELGEGYRWSLVGEPSRKYLWVLSRVPEMEEALLERILARARAQGYKTNTIIRTPQRTEEGTQARALSGD